MHIQSCGIAHALLVDVDNEALTPGAAVNVPTKAGLMDLFRGVNATVVKIEPVEFAPLVKRYSEGINRVFGVVTV
jgi:hypothetical protein